MRWVLGLVLVGAMAWSPAWAEVTVKEYLRVYNAATPDDKKHLEELSQAFYQGTLQASAYVSVVRGEDKLFCPPHKLDITGSQLMNILGNYVKAHPEFSGDNPKISLFFALRDVFPCPLEDAPEMAPKN
jgi:hypothetical protein